MYIIFDYEKDIKFRPSAGDGEITGLLSNDVDFNNFLIEWNEMRKKHYNDEITDEEFEDWKVNYPDSLKKDYVPFEESNLKRFHNSMSVKIPPEIK